MSKPKKEVVRGICSYCGNEDEMEPEHVVPRSIFVNKNQSKIEIPACHACNNKKSAGEDDLRDWMIITVGVDGHPDIYRLMQAMGEAYGKGLSKIAEAATEERKLTLQQTKSGIHIPAYAVPFHDSAPMEMTLRFVARGLYFYEFNQPWLPDQPVSLSFAPTEDFDETIEYFQHVFPFVWGKPLGKNVFNWMPFTRFEEPGKVAILMTFFGKVAIIAWMGIQEEGESQLSFDQLIRRKGKREKLLRGIVDRHLIMPPPDDMLGFLRWHEEKKKRTPPGGEAPVPRT